MKKLKAVFYPTILGDIVPFYNNAFNLLTASLALKYGITPAKMTLVTNSNSDMPKKRNDAVAADLAAKSAFESQNKEFDNGKDNLTDVFNDINKSTILDETDAEALGMRKVHTPPDPNTAKPKVSNKIALATVVILDWIKGAWFGVNIYGSYDGITWVKLDKDMRSPFEDLRKNQVINVPETRWYKLRYIDKTEKEIGLESDPVKIVAEIY